jgi:tetratricopeptide (TPR) repeat protein
MKFKTINTLKTLSKRSGRWLWDNLSIRNTENHLNVFVSLAIRLIGLALLLFACLLIWRLIENEDYSLEAISVPKTWEESGAYMAQNIQDALQQLKEGSQSVKMDSLHVGNAAVNDFNVSVMGLDLSIKNIAHQIRLLFGRPVRTIGGELRQSGTTLYLTLRVSGFDPVRLEVPVNTAEPEEAINSVCKKAAESLLGMTDPYRLAVVCYRENRQDEAIELVRKIIRERPHERKWAYIAWGSVLEDQAKHALAAAKFQRATELDSSFALAWHRWGTSLSNLKQYRETVPKYEMALRLNPSEPVLWLRLAGLYRYLGDQAACGRATEEAIHYSKGKQESSVLMSCAELKFNQDSTAAAEKLLQKVIALEGESSRGYLAKSMLSYARQDTDAIIQNGIYSSELDPSNFYGPRMAMMTAISRRQYDKVIEIASNLDFRKADKSYGVMLHNLVAVAYNMTNRPDSAFASIRRAIAVDSTEAYPYSTMGEIYALHGNMGRFYALLEKALQMGMPVRAIDSNFPPYNGLKNDARYNALLAKYSLKN